MLVFKMADEDQIRLANIVKAVHGKLRQELRQGGGDYQTLWARHCSDQESLLEYAQAMHMLAAKHWTKNSAGGRVEWCFKTALKFFKQEGLQSAMEKQRRRILFSGTGRFCCCCCFTEQSPGRCTKIIHPVVEDSKLMLLDVGSCFNPFEVYEDVVAVAIDLQPAIESVYKCDFLQLSIEDDKSSDYCCCCTVGTKYSKPQETQLDSTRGRGDRNIDGQNIPTSGKLPLAGSSDEMSHKDNLCCHSEINHSSMQRYLGGTEMTELPSGSFHVVVFSLLLSYLPSPHQRWACCVKAYRLLAVNGLLLIITPDSSHQNRNAHMVKSWKLALESIGFVRWCYVKETHLHCMAFRKVAQCHSHEHGNASPEMLFIPQDYQEDGEEMLSDNAPRTEQEDLEICEFFSELPNSDD